MRALAAVTLFALLLGAGPAAADKLKIVQVEVDRYPCTLVAVAVIGDKGRARTGLKVDAFRLEEQGRPQKVRQFAEAQKTVMVQADPLPMDVVLVIDTSGSMDGPPLEQARRAAEIFLDQLTAQDRVAVVRFDSTSEVLSPMGPVDQALREKLRALKSSGGTYLYEAIHQAVEQVAPEEGRTRAIVALTDGQSGEAAHTLETSIADCLQKGIPVQCVGLGAADPTQLRRLAGETGGKLHMIAAPEELVELYRQLAGELRMVPSIDSVYFLSYRSDHLRWSPATVQLRVRVGEESESLSFEAPAQSSYLLLALLPALLLGLFVAWSSVLVWRNGSVRR